MWKQPIKISDSFLPWIILFNITVVTVLAVVSSSSIAIANSSISGPLMIDQTDSLWLSTSYLAAVGSFLPLSGWLGKNYGNKFTFFGGVSIFVLASLLAIFSKNFTFLLIMRIFEGMGGGLIYPISLTIIQQAFPLEKKTLGLTIYLGLGFGLGASIGFIIGGYIGQYKPWEWIFLINVITGIPCLIFTWLFQPESETDKSEQPFDFLGLIFFGGFLASLLILLTNVKASWNTLGWESTFSKGFITASILSLILLIARALSYADPIIKIYLFKQKYFAVGCGILFFVGIFFFGTVVILPPLFEKALGYQKSTIGFIMLSYALIMAPASSFVGYITKFINIRILILAGLICLIISCFIQKWIITVQSEHWQWYIVLIIRALGVSLSLGPVTSLALEKVVSADSPGASVLVAFSRQIGGAIGTTLILLIGVYREAFYSQIYGSNINIHAPTFQAYTEAYGERFERILGFSTTESATLAKLMVVKSVKIQAYISAVNDAYFIMGCIGIVITVIVSSIMIPELLKIRKRSSI